MSSAPTPEGPGSVSGAPNSQRVHRHLHQPLRRHRELRLHAVIGGEGPPLLLVHGWPADLVRLAHTDAGAGRDFQVIAVDQRGIGLSDKPPDGYDTGTLAGDLVALMEALGHDRFAVYGTDTGMPIAYALAADHPDRVERLAVSEALLPGMSTLTAAAPAPAAQRPALAPRLQPAPRRGQRSTREGTGGRLLRRPVRRLGRDDKLPDRRRQLLRRPPRRRPRRPARQLRVLPGVRRHHRPERAAQDPAADHARPGHRRRARAPVRWSASTMRLVADDVQTVVIPGGGHWVAEQAPEELLAALTEFLAPYRIGAPA